MPTLACEAGGQVPADAPDRDRSAGSAAAAGDEESLRAEAVALLDERQVLRRKVITLRDHAVGAEAELGHARREHARMSRELAEAKHAVAELRASASWRVGQLAVAPLSKVRRALRGGE